MPPLPDVTVNVRNLAVGGAGVGEVIAQSDGKDELLGITAFVPFAAVGEVVSARVTQHKERYLKTQLLQVETPAAERVAPTCPYYTVCGGCELQHMSYSGQLAAKTEMIAGALRAAKSSSQVLQALKPVVPGEPYSYRRRVTLHIDSSGKVGFYREQSRSVVAIEQCPVSVPPIDEVLRNVQELGRRLQGKISSLLLEADAKGLVAVLKSPYDLTPTEQTAILNSVRDFLPNVSLMGGEREVGGLGRQILELPLNDGATTTLRVPAGAFSQVNWGINLKLIRRVIDSANL
ncbi:MAG: class I SAM-dependent RNA methyltransferase, partial [Bdellovibrionales bacterium]|nr:class I SAM-dependent RNA methyltransferase [Bdellovibrionales bacterium]